jgi:hypothetical protein
MISDVPDLTDADFEALGVYDPGRRTLGVQVRRRTLGGQRSNVR